MRIRDWSSDVCSSDLAVAANHAEMAVDVAQANQAAVDRLIDASARARFLAGLAASSNDPAMIAKLERIAAPLSAAVRKPYDKVLASLKERSVSRPRIKRETASWLDRKSTRLNSSH